MDVIVNPFKKRTINLVLKTNMREALADVMVIKGDVFVGLPVGLLDRPEKIR